MNYTSKELLDLSNLITMLHLLDTVMYDPKQLKEYFNEDIL